MKVIAAELLIPTDIDDTLICWSSSSIPKEFEGKGIPFIDPYTGGTLYVAPHKPNIKVMMNYLERGASIIVWSRSGYRWAEAALKALGIDHHNIYIATKPLLYIDDKPCQEWMGEQVNLPIDSPWGQ